MKWIILLATFMSVAACKSIKYVPVETTKIEKEYIDRWKRDSIHVHDSVFVLMKGDTVYRDRFHTVYKDRYFHDTTFIHKVDSVQVPYPVEKPLSRWQNFKLSIGGFAISGIIVLIIVGVGYMVYKIKK